MGRTNSQKGDGSGRQHDVLISYSNWSPGQPSGGIEDCLETADTLNGTWNDRLCFRVLKFICEQE